MTSRTLVKTVYHNQFVYDLTLLRQPRRRFLNYYLLKRFFFLFGEKSDMIRFTFDSELNN